MLFSHLSSGWILTAAAVVRSLTESQKFLIATALLWLKSPILLFFLQVTFQLLWGLIQGVCFLLSSWPLGNGFHSGVLRFNFEVFPTLLFDAKVLSGLSAHVTFSRSGVHPPSRELIVPLLCYSVIGLSKTRWIVPFYVLSVYIGLSQKIVFFGLALCFLPLSCWETYLNSRVSTSWIEHKVQL